MLGSGPAEHLPREATEAPAEPGDDLHLVGTTLGAYWIHSFLGRGAMARVYRAEHRILKRPCALKVLHAPAGEARDALELLYREARAAAGLVHPNVVTVHNVGRIASRRFIELEFVSGPTLERRVVAEGPLDPILASRLLAGVAHAVATAHDAGLVHRDIKPANILLAPHGVAKIADFGLVAPLSARIQGGLGTIRPGGKVAGTPYFMAPEAFRGGAVGPPADIYALGVTYYYLLTGRVPFRAGSLGELVRLHEHEEVPRIDARGDEVLAAAAEIISRCLAKKPGDRYESAFHLQSDLLAVPGTARDMETLLRDALEVLDVSWERVDEGYVATVPLAGGRSHRILIEATNEPRLADRLVRIFAICAPLETAYLQTALELNARLAHGAVAIASVGGAPHFIVQNCYPRATCDPEEIRHSVTELARLADQLERDLTGVDHH